MNYETELNNLKAAQQRAATADLEKTRNQALSDLQAEQMKNSSTYAAQRSSANAQNRMSAKNFQEYLASTGRANSGLSAQARMQNANNLSTSLNSLNAGEAAALADINRRTTDANNAYNSGLASANATIEADYIKNLLDQREKALARELQEKQYQEQIKARELQERQFQESIRQFNENLALQREQLYSRFNSGSGGGSSSSKSSGKSGSAKGTNNESVQFSDTPKEEKKVSLADRNAASRNAAKNGETYVKHVQTKQGGIAEQLWKKTKNGDVRVR